MIAFTKEAVEAFVMDPGRGAVRLTTGAVHYDLDGQLREITAALRRGDELRKLAEKPDPPANLPGLLGSFLQGIGGHQQFPNGRPLPQGREYVGNFGGQLLNQALGGLMGGVVKGPATALGDRITSALGMGPALGDRHDLIGMAGTGMAQGASKAMGEAAGNLLADIANKAITSVGNAMDNGKRKALVDHLRETDSVLSGRTDEELMGAYHTMVNFAPILSMDANAVRSFLREAVMSGAGPSYVTIKNLADSESAVRKARER